MTDCLSPKPSNDYMRVSAEWQTDCKLYGRGPKPSTPSPSPHEAQEACNEGRFGVRGT